jgi:cell division protease FtsH
MEPTDKRRAQTTLLFLGLALAVTFAMQALLAREAPREVAYSELVTLANAGRVVEAALDEQHINATIRAADAPASTEHVVATRLPSHDDRALLDALATSGARISGHVEDSGIWTSLLVGWVLPIGLMIAAWTAIARRMSRTTGPLSVGRSQAKIYDRNVDSRVTFDDVAGVDEAKGELTEVVSYLTMPEKYRAIGARAPKGILLVGPPGTGKTLLARAVAGEANVPFFAISGSEFVQMFVGVGAARVRDLFEQAKQRAPCIVFIDELDAIGRSRAGAVAGAMVHEEREQTLNQLLVEMDGFEGGAGVVILAATNRPEVLDRALLRAGRFDRQVVVDRPDVRGRAAILRVHARRVKLAEGVDLDVVSRRTPGMAGADLANVVNEAALAATRRNATATEMRDFEEAVDRIQLGLRKQGRVMTEAERRRVAFHEAGHALVAMRVEHADPVHRVTIVPRSIGALGVTLQLPTEDRYLVTERELLDRLAVMLGGRAAEEVIDGDVSTGAENDLERATETARLMVTRFGMSSRLGAVSYGAASSRYLDFGIAPREVSEQTAHAIDEEVRALVEAQHERARSLLRAEQSTLRAIANRLLADETIEGAELAAIVRENAARNAA